MHARISVNIPGYFSAYNSVERLEAYGCAKSTLRVLGPLTRKELSGAAARDEKVECQAPEWLLVEREMVNWPQHAAEARVRLLSIYDYVPLLGQEASAQLPFSTLQGRTGFPGTNLYGEFYLGSEGGGGGGEWGFAGAITPGFVGAWDEDRHIYGRFYLHEGYIKAGYRRTEILYGRIHPHFGDLLHGGLFLSADARPQNMLKLSVRPHIVGSPLSFLGPLAFETWLTDLGDASSRSGSKLWATALAIRPWGFLELGWLHAIQLGGVGAPAVEGADLLSIIFYSNNPTLDQKRRESSAWHLGVWGPQRFVKVYSQGFFNKLGAVGDWFQNDLGILVGVWFPKLGEGDVRFEYVHTPPALYAHGIWRQGWSSEGRSLGHPIGSDGEAVYLDVGLPPLSTWRPALGFTYESRNRSGGYSLSTGWRYGGSAKIINRWERMEITIELKHQSVFNFHYSPDDTRNAVDIFSELRYSFL